MVPLLQFINPSQEICIARLTINVSIAYVLNISLVFIKSQKLLQAFLSKVALTRKEAKRTASLQIFIVIVLLLITNVLTAILSFGKTSISSYLDEQKLERVHYCDTSFHSNIVIAFIMLIQFACFVQAFRGRHLPSVMNDGMSLVYASFATIVMFSVMYVIIIFQNPIEKELYQNLTVIMNTLIIFIALYGQKAVRILAYPHQNTRAYFQESRMIEMKQRFNDLTQQR